MDEVENPSLPAAGESSPVVKPSEIDELSTSTAIASFEPILDIDSQQDPQDISLPSTNAPSHPPPRPSLPRNTSAPPPGQPPPAPPSGTAAVDFSRDAPDSLTLADLKRIRSTFPNVVPPQRQEVLQYEKIYDFKYEDAQSFAVELEEWFSYSEEEDMKLRRCKAVFNEEWRDSEDGKQDWLEVTEDARRAFVKKRITCLQEAIDEKQVTSALMVLTYIGLGVWEETAGRREGCALEDLFPRSAFPGSRLDDFGHSSLQIQWIVAMVDTLHASNGVNVIYDTLRRVCDRVIAAESLAEMPARSDGVPRRGDESIEMWCCLTLMYLFIEIARSAGSAAELKKDILKLQPNLLSYLTQIVAKLRWDEQAPVPLTKMFLLAWKAVLFFFGGLSELDHVKNVLRDESGEEATDGRPLITASPLDYHLFRQEISSKYPAYQAPPTYFPQEPESNSILPPLKHRRQSFAASDTGYGGMNAGVTGSIMHQPLHIATPAPSPPPSPAGPGKAGKKQNYQTNQLFPFLYPPLDASSNDLGGKGTTELQDVLVGRRWEGSDVPASILEAAELFSKRMHATRAMKQLWATRVDYMKQERGWEDLEHLPEVDDDFELVPKSKPIETAEQGAPLSRTPEQEILDRVTKYYRDSLPHMQSFVIVALKAVLQGVNDMVSIRGNGTNGLQAGIQLNDMNGTNGGKPMENGIGQVEQGIDGSIENMDRLRSHEICFKALTGMMLLMLKWFKLSHILQYEYMTQLLLDSNYVPLVLKIWQAQDIGRACHFNMDQDERNFFYFCRQNSRCGIPPESLVEAPRTTEEESDDEDDAAPPPIKMKRSDPQDEMILSPSSDVSVEFQHPPEVDELGYPQTALPNRPIKNFSYRNTFSAINYLRILQKITRGKAHRALLLVSYKATNHLKKTLRIPVELLRYYTLKLCKSQVPFCGRKWRQSHMKIITAVWLSVPAELRDDWLLGGGGGMGGGYIGDVDGTVEDAVPMEQSLRALTHWWNIQNFPDVMGVDKGMLEDEMDYFTRELEKMELIREEELGEEQSMPEEPWAGPIEGY